MFDREPKRLYKGGMKIMVNIRMDSRLKKAIEKLAENQAINFSALVRQTMIEKLSQYGIDWREEELDD